MKKELKVSAIENGTVIDHIPADAALKVARLLDLENHAELFSIASNLQSKRQGKKAIIKISGKYLTSEEVNKIALVAPDVTVNIITNFEVKKKTEVQLPNLLLNLIQCSNPNCITNHESVTTKFYVLGKEPMKVKCHYCEHVFGAKDIELM